VSRFHLDKSGSPWKPKCFPGFAVIDSLTNSLERYMDVLSARQKVVASNIANADTPGYKTKDLNFQSELRAALSPEVMPFEVGGLPVKNDGNNVNLDREARLLSENAMRFSFASALMRSQIQSIKEAINEGKTGA
jgi:flagellar basal-body rod protein FlgB